MDRVGEVKIESRQFNKETSAIFMTKSNEWDHSKNEKKFKFEKKVENLVNGIL